MTPEEYENDMNDPSYMRQLSGFRRYLRYVREQGVYHCCGVIEIPCENKECRGHYEYVQGILGTPSLVQAAVMESCYIMKKGTTCSSRTCTDANGMRRKSTVSICMHCRKPYDSKKGEHTTCGFLLFPRRKLQARPTNWEMLTDTQRLVIEPKYFCNCAHCQAWADTEEALDQGMLDAPVATGYEEVCMGIVNLHNAQDRAGDLLKAGYATVCTDDCTERAREAREKKSALPEETSQHSNSVVELSSSDDSSDGSSDDSSDGSSAGSRGGSRGGMSTPRASIEVFKYRRYYVSTRPIWKTLFGELWDTRPNAEEGTMARKFLDAVKITPKARMKNACKATRHTTEAEMEMTVEDIMEEWIVTLKKVHEDDAGQLALVFQLEYGVGNLATSTPREMHTGASEAWTPGIELWEQYQSPGRSMSTVPSGMKLKF